ncbi:MULTISPECIES: hypothetical protein [Moorena]|nr:MULTISPECIES: hypothetical protein [Moorena]NES85262.1 hypothetical protein [Moorena sp. SIO2B7]NEP30521.1 hypothetical protein [Moorena sp. SIO3B2]NEP65974.1 hypothetical protein [Moorena sp. SIO3A5]NEQ11289.1 hypothetical protein [Moorena sp. SIO4E2]NER86788.1 hypothetical protein [Moorena sp. SIO3A2]
MLDYATFICQSASKKRNDSVIVYWSDNYEILGNRESGIGNREFGRGNH